MKQNESKATMLPVNGFVNKLRTEKADGYEIGQQYEGYLTFNADSTISFKRKEKRYYRNGFQTIKTNEDFTIQKSERFVKVTLTLELKKLNFNIWMRILSRLSDTMDSLKLTPIN